ncbi:TraR/DksA C4-type zinc finger protein [Sporosarcina sp. G11-34]|uniref:TraR/DksA C4-type zinc finger protein n=1 Tax=Sporosarcina sp. G11-34 TaxID=2849605 RepID=UPI0022A97D18|nr:TraR/DksA C4-type zinc finger protein [Sporosarcina sp. G11-34]
MQKSTLKEALLEMKDQSKTLEDETYPKKGIKETSGELSMYDNHPADMGTALFDREKDLALHEHAESELGKVNDALAAMEEGTYGKCKVCKQDISFERLEAVPYTTLCIEHAKEEEQSVKEDATVNSVKNPFESTMDGRALDYENSFKEVAEFGTSDSPSDFTDSENPTYSDKNDDDTSYIDKIVGNSITDIPNES